MSAWLSSGWIAAMLCIIPLFAIEYGNSAVPWDKVRTWVALVTCSALEWIVTPAHGATPFFWYIAIDAAALWVIGRHPATAWQYMVAACFVPMLIGHVAMLWAGRATGGETYWSLNMILGWAQFSLLAAWGTIDGGKAVWAGHRRHGDSVADRARGSVPR